VAVAVGALYFAVVLRRGRGGGGCGLFALWVDGLVCWFGGGGVVGRRPFWGGAICSCVCMAVVFL